MRLIISAAPDAYHGFITANENQLETKFLHTYTYIVATITACMLIYLCII